MTKKYIKSDTGDGNYFYAYDGFDTNEIMIEKGEAFLLPFLWLIPYINWFEYKDKIFFLCLDNDDVMLEFRKNHIEGMRYLGETTALSALENFAVDFDLKGALINEILNSEMDGWYSKDKKMRHYVIIRDTQVEFLSKQDVWTEVTKNNLIMKKYIPLEKKMKIPEIKFKNKIEYTLAFRNTEEIEDLSVRLLLKDKKKINFMGIETYRISDNNKIIEDFLEFTRIYFLFNDKYKIIIEYESLESEQYLILKKEYRKEIYEIEKNVFFCHTVNSEFYRKSYNESGFFENINEFNDRNIGHIYIADDYIIELVIAKSIEFPKIRILDINTNNEIEQQEILK